MSKVTIIGAGRTGRGMFGEMFFSEGGIDLAFGDINPELIRSLREQGHYVVEQTNLDSGMSKATCVSGFKVYDARADREAYLKRLAESDYIAVAVFPSSFDDVARDLADMARLRRKSGSGQKAAVILGGNFVGLRSYFSGALRKLLDDDDYEIFDGQVALVTSKANRKMTFSSKPGAKPLSLEGDDKPFLPVEDRFLFGDGYEYPSFFKRSDDVELRMAEKIWSENLLHCSLGFMGAYYGFATINDVASDEFCADLARRAWKEGRAALEAEYGIPVPDDSFFRTMLDKFKSPHFRDRIDRVVRQPMRKLGRHDRFLGPALLCLKHGIVPFFTLRAAAYGFLFSDEKDEQVAKIAKILSATTLEDAVVKITGLDASVSEEATACGLLIGFIQELQCLEKQAPRVPACEEGVR